ncbi:MAG: hypothetical protein IJX78_07055 [Bacilli bacterium]|nr:hypothetical protein [Bacilli bacterium]
MIVKGYLKKHPQNVGEDLIIISGEIGCIVVGELESIKQIIKNLKPNEYYLEPLIEVDTYKNILLK